jgi:hypothetical protein
MVFRNSRNFKKIWICRELNKEQLYLLELFKIRDRILIKKSRKL